MYPEFRKLEAETLNLRLLQDYDDSPTKEDREMTDGELMSKTYNQVVDMYMCSEECPCDEKAKEIWDKVPDYRLKQHGTEANGTTPLVFLKEDKANNIFTYQNWIKCYKDKL